MCCCATFLGEFVWKLDSCVSHFFVRLTVISIILLAGVILICSRYLFMLEDLFLQCVMTTLNKSCLLMIHLTYAYLLENLFTVAVNNIQVQKLLQGSESTDSECLLTEQTLKIWPLLCYSLTR